MNAERPYTPTRVLDNGSTRITVKRTCERCHRPIGDATEQELEASIAGHPLPSVVDECGCVAVTEQLAMFDQRHDAIIHGSTVDGVSHPTWDELGPGARDEYVADALNSLRALVHLGWAPLDRVLEQIGDAS